MAFKATFVLDQATIVMLDRTAARLRKPKSAIVREAIREYDARADRLSEAERTRMMRAIEGIMSTPPTRAQHEVDRELRELRKSRQQGWHRAK